MRGVEQALPDGWIPRARVASTRANATSESPPRVSVRARERVTIEPFARRCVRWPPRASRGSLRQEIPPPTFGRGEARLSGAVLWCGRTSGGPRACICINRMGNQSLQNTRSGFLHSICTPANFICRGESGEDRRVCVGAHSRPRRPEKEGPGDATVGAPPCRSLPSTRWSSMTTPSRCAARPRAPRGCPPLASFETRPGVAETSIRADGDPACRLSRATRPRADASLVSSRRRSPPRRINGSPEGPRYASAPPSLARTRPTTRPAKRLSRGRPRLNLESNPLAPPPARGRPRLRAALLPHHPSRRVTSATRAPTPRSHLPAHVSSPLPPPRPVLLLRRRARCPPSPTGSPAPRRRRTS